MKTLDTSAISTTVGMPVKAGSLVHIQSAYTEVISEISKHLAGDTYSTSTAYRVSGLLNSGGTISAGSIFLNGEIYLVDSFVLPSPANASLDTTFFTDVSADPVDFTDGTPRSVHQIRKIIFGATTGLGFTYTDLVELGANTYLQTNTIPSPTVFLDTPRMYFRSFPVTSETSLTINVDATGAIDGVESVFVFQSKGVAVSFTHTLTGFTSNNLMGVGGYANPLVVSVGNNLFYVFKYKCFKRSGSFIMASIEVLENN